MEKCKHCKFWGKDFEGVCDRVNHSGIEKIISIWSYASDDTGLETRLVTGPDFGCVLFEHKVPMRYSDGVFDRTDNPISVYWHMQFMGLFSFTDSFVEWLQENEDSRITKYAIMPQRDICDLWKRYYSERCVG